MSTLVFTLRAKLGPGPDAVPHVPEPASGPPPLAPLAPVDYCALPGIAAALVCGIPA